MNSWKEPFNTYNSLIWIFSIFWLLNWLNLHSIVHYRSFPSAATVLFMQVIQKSASSYERIKTAKRFIELWTNQKQTGNSALVQSKGTKTIWLILQNILFYDVNLYEHYQHNTTYRVVFLIQHTFWCRVLNKYLQTQCFVIGLNKGIQSMARK
jgi:hypothetical protein